MDGRQSHGQATIATVIHCAELLNEPTPRDYFRGRVGAVEGMSPKLHLPFQQALLWYATYPAQATTTPAITTIDEDHGWLPRVDGTQSHGQATIATVIHCAELLK